MRLKPEKHSGKKRSAEKSTSSADSAKVLPAALPRVAADNDVTTLCVSSVSSYIPGPDEVRALNAMVYEGAEANADLYIPFTYVNPMHGERAIAMLEAIGMDIPAFQQAWHSDLKRKYGWTSVVLPAIST